MINYTVVLKSELNFTERGRLSANTSKTKKQLLLLIILLFFTVCTLFIGIRLNKQFYTGGH